MGGGGCFLIVPERFLAFRILFSGEAAESWGRRWGRRGPDKQPWGRYLPDRHVHPNTPSAVTRFSPKPPFNPPTYLRNNTPSGANNASNRRAASTCSSTGSSPPRRLLNGPLTPPILTSCFPPSTLFSYFSFQGDSLLRTHPQSSNLQNQRSRKDGP